MPINPSSPSYLSPSPPLNTYVPCPTRKQTKHICSSPNSSSASAANKTPSHEVHTHTYADQLYTHTSNHTPSLPFPYSLSSMDSRQKLRSMLWWVIWVGVAPSGYFCRGIVDSLKLVRGLKARPWNSHSIILQLKNFTDSST